MSESDMPKGYRNSDGGLSMKNERVFCTGVAGSIGSELCRQLAKDNVVTGLDLNEGELLELDAQIRDRNQIFAWRVGDIRDLSTVEECFDDFRPTVVFHCAARKSVDAMERMPQEVVNTNINGTWNVVKAAKRRKVKRFIFLSTDKAIGTSIMGISKKFGEVLTRNQGKGFIVVRLGNVKYSRGSVMRIWKRQMTEGLPLTITHPDMERFFMSIEEAVQLTIHAAEEGTGGEVYVLDMGEPQRIERLAREVGGPSVALKVIGIRPGETMQEKLMTLEESEKAVKRGRFWVIP